jgi:hypothetical protein
VSAFVDNRRERFGVEPICRTLGVSAPACYQRASPSAPAKHQRPGPRRARGSRRTRPISAKPTGRTGARDPWLVSAFAVALMAGWWLLESWALAAGELADLDVERDPLR